MRRSLAVLLWVTSIGCGGEATSESPAFSLEYRMMSRFPTCLGNHRIRIDSSGAVYSVTNRSECPPGEQWSAPYPADPVRRLSRPERAALWREVEASGVMAMPDSTDSGVGTDGVIEEIEITRGSGSRIVKGVSLPGAGGAGPGEAGSFAGARAAILRAAGETR